MDPRAGRRSTPPTSAPRPRGDGPCLTGKARTWYRCSPQPRGCSHRHPPVAWAHARSPRPRGWTRPQPGHPRRVPLLPAPAGMDPGWWARRAGSGAAPCSRGDDPCYAETIAERFRCSPSTRGWTPGPGPDDGHPALLPAPAGMAPARRTRPPGRHAAPCARGDDPTASSTERSRPTCSPRPRGWTRGMSEDRGAEELLPAPAGMNPRQRCHRAAHPAAPRPRGDGPARISVWTETLYGVTPAAPPVLLPARAGWSHELKHVGRGLVLLPACAGMVPRLPTS